MDINTNTTTRNKKTVVLAAFIAVIALAAVIAASTLVSNATGTGADIVNLNENGTPIQGEVYQGSPSDEQSELQIRQDGTDMSYSTDGGKTWTDEMPADSGMSLQVEEQ
jgi:Neuraminidase (sialidase)